MRVALVADEDPGWGGIGTYTGVLGRALADLGHDVRLVLRGWEEDRVETLDGLTVHRVCVPEPHWRRGTVALVSRLYVARESLIFSARASRLLAGMDLDVVEAPEFHAAALVGALRARVRRRSPALVVRLHAPSFMTASLAAERPDLDVRAGEALEAVSAHCAGLITSPSLALAELVTRRWRIAPRRVRIVPNPIDERLFTPAGEPAETPGSLLIVGRVERNKGQDLLVEALPEVRRAVPEAHLITVGADGGARAELEQRARAAGIAEAVTFAGPRPRQELPASYRDASICVVPSRFEAFPYTALEAMACGRPVIAARVGGLGELIEDGRDGILVEPESPAALAQAIIGLLRDAPERRRLAEAARQRVLDAYAAGKVAARMVDHYGEAIR